MMTMMKKKRSRNERKRGRKVGKDVDQWQSKAILCRTKKNNNGIQHNEISKNSFYP